MSLFACRRSLWSVTIWSWVQGGYIVRMVGCLPRGTWNPWQVFLCILNWTAQPSHASVFKLVPYLSIGETRYISSWTLWWRKVSLSRFRSVGEKYDWCHPMVVVPKKDSAKPRITVDLTAVKFVKRLTFHVRPPRITCCWKPSISSVGFWKCCIWPVLCGGQRFSHHRGQILGMAGRYAFSAARCYLGACYSGKRYDDGESHSRPVSFWWWPDKLQVTTAKRFTKQTDLHYNVTHWGPCSWLSRTARCCPQEDQPNYKPGVAPIRVINF